MSNSILLSVALALFIYILLMIYYKDSSNNFLLSVSTGLFSFLLYELFIGESSVFLLLEKRKNNKE